MLVLCAASLYGSSAKESKCTYFHQNKNMQYCSHDLWEVISKNLHKFKHWTWKLGVSWANLCLPSQICGPDWICEICNFQCRFSGTSGHGMGEFCWDKTFKHFLFVFWDRKIYEMIKSYVETFEKTYVLEISHPHPPSLLLHPERRTAGQAGNSMIILTQTAAAASRRKLIYDFFLLFWWKKWWTRCMPSVQK